MITKAELLMGRDKLFPAEYTEQISENLDVYVQKMNVIRVARGLPMICVSGWRPLAINSATPNASQKSWHIFGCAGDWKDYDGAHFNWALQNLDLFESLSLYIEDPRWTSTKEGHRWLHIQDIAPPSGKRIFIPQKGLAPFPNIWDGKYDSKYDG